MKILCLADKESPALWDFFNKEYFKEIDLIISCGDLKASYLSFLTTMTSLPVLYVHGNHDDSYAERPPEGCTCIEDTLYCYKGVRILGLGGSYRYKPGEHQFTDRQMAKRVRKLWLPLHVKKGFDILVTHAPALGVNDGEDLTHRGFEVFGKLIDQYRPKYFVHGHVHMNYGRQFPREDTIGETRVINAYEKYIIEI